MDIVSMFYCTFYFFKIVLCAVNLSMIKKSSWKHDCDNNHELEPVGLPKNGVLQVLSSWENQTILKCLKHHRKNCFTFNIFWELKMESLDTPCNTLRRHSYSPKLRLILSKACANSGDLLRVSSFKSWSCIKLNLQHKI